MPVYNPYKRHATKPRVPTVYHKCLIKKKRKFTFTTGTALGPTDKKFWVRIGEEGLVRA